MKQGVQWTGLKALELVMALSLVFILLASVAATFVNEQAALQHWLNRHAAILAAIAVFECGLLLLWMCLGGQNSKLWNWLPPFCFIPQVLWVKWIVVVGMIAGTLAGIFAGKAVR